MGQPELEAFHCDVCGVTQYGVGHRPGDSTCLEFHRQERYAESVYSRDGSRNAESRGWIQWKGTDVCIDLHCVCGAMGHYDGYHMYSVKCRDCGRKFRVGDNVTLIELTDDQQIADTEVYWGDYKEFGDDD